MWAPSRTFVHAAGESPRIARDTTRDLVRWDAWPGRALECCSQPHRPGEWKQQHVPQRRTSREGEEVHANVPAYLAAAARQQVQLVQEVGLKRLRL